MMKLVHWPTPSTRWPMRWRRTAAQLKREIAERTQAQESLARANNDLEQRVGERTAELVAEIGERKQAEEAVRESEAQLNAYFNASPTGMANGGPATAVFESQPATGRRYRACRLRNTLVIPFAKWCRRWPTFSSRFTRRCLQRASPFLTSN